MGYRDELEAAHARIRALESEVAELKGDTALERAGRATLSGRLFETAIELQGELLPEQQVPALAAATAFIGETQTIETRPNGFSLTRSSKGASASVELRSGGGVTTIAVRVGLQARLWTLGLLFSLGLCLSLAIVGTLAGFAWHFGLPLCVLAGMVGAVLIRDKIERDMRKETDEELLTLSKTVAGLLGQADEER